jgi:hypothetical protein
MSSIGENSIGGGCRSVIINKGPLIKGCIDDYSDEAVNEDHLSRILGKRSMLCNSFGQRSTLHNGSIEA